MKFTMSHEWIRVDGEVGVVGVTAYAVSELGEVVYLELPVKGRVVKAGEEVAVLESTKAAADLYSPVSGEIIEVNESLSQSLEPLNRSSEGEGWLFKIRLSDLKEVDSLLSKRPEEGL